MAHITDFISIHVQISSQCFVTIENKNQLDEFADDTIAYCAKECGVSPHNLILYFKERHHQIRCSAKTRNGTRCKNPVQGSFENPEEFVRMYIGYCSVHGR